MIVVLLKSLSTYLLYRKSNPIFEQTHLSPLCSSDNHLRLCECYMPVPLCLHLLIITGTDSIHFDIGLY